MFIPPAFRLFSGSEEGTAVFSAFSVLISNGCGSAWAPTRMFSNAEHSEKGCTLSSITQDSRMVGGWLRPRHERSPSTHMHTELLNSFVTRKLEKFANHFLKILDHESQHLPAHQPWVHCPLSSNRLPKLLRFHRHIPQPECLEHSTGSAKPLREKERAQLFPF